MANNVIDFQKMKDRKEAIEWIEYMFDQADNLKFNSDYTKIDQYDYNTKSYSQISFLGTCTLSSDKIRSS